MEGAIERQTDNNTEFFKNEIKALFGECMKLHERYLSAQEGEKKDLIREINMRIEYLIFELGHFAFAMAGSLKERMEISSVMVDITTSDDWKKLEETNGIKAIAYASSVEADANMLVSDKRNSVERLV